MNAEQQGQDLRIIPLEDLLREHEESHQIYETWQVQFHGLPDGITAYNASDIFMVQDGEEEVPHLLARTEVEGGDGEFTSKVEIFRISADGRDCWPTGISNLPELVENKITQDPAIARVNGMWVISWVEVTPNDLLDPSKGSSFKSVACIGETLDTLRHHVDTSEETKGLRHVELTDGRVGTTTRRFIDGIGKTCFVVCDSLEEITTELLDSAQVVEGLETDKGWGGPNQLIQLPNNDVEVLGHLAWFEGFDDDLKRKYVATSYVITPPPVDTPDIPATADYLSIIAAEEDFNISTDILPAKRPDLEHVAYPSCLMLDKDGGPAILLVALRDSGEAGARIEDPLKQWRADHPEAILKTSQSLSYPTMAT